LTLTSMDWVQRLLVMEVFQEMEWKALFNKLGVGDVSTGGVAEDSVAEDSDDFSLPNPNAPVGAADVPQSSAASPYDSYVEKFGSSDAMLDWLRWGEFFLQDPVEAVRLLGEHARVGTGAGDLAGTSIAGEPESDLSERLKVFDPDTQAVFHIILDRMNEYQRQMELINQHYQMQQFQAFASQAQTRLRELSSQLPPDIELSQQDMQTIVGAALQRYGGQLDPAFYEWVGPKVLGRGRGGRRVRESEQHGSVNGSSVSAGDLVRALADEM
jgi:hypothetical protein